jgi:hypothetical protein
VLTCFSSGFSLYGQRILGQTPCYSIPAHPVTAPPAVSEQLSSLSSALGSTSPVRVTVITETLLALSLPLENGVESVTRPNEGLSLGAKVGIGVGTGLGIIIAVTLIVWLVLYIRRHRRDETTYTGSDVATRPTGTRSSTPAMSSTVSGSISNPPWSPPQRPTSYDDGGYSPGPGGGQPWYPSQPQQQQPYVRTPPPRAQFPPIQTPYPGQQFGGPVRYPNLPEAE